MFVCSCVAVYVIYRLTDEKMEKGTDGDRDRNRTRHVKMPIIENQYRAGKYSTPSCNHWRYWRFYVKNDVNHK